MDLKKVPMKRRSWPKMQAGPGRTLDSLAGAFEHQGAQ
jgi:hypothetical protein